VKRFPTYGYQLYFADESSTKEIEANVNSIFNHLFAVLTTDHYQLETFLKVLHSDLGPDGAQITAKGALRPYVLGDVPFKSGTLLSDEVINSYCDAPRTNIDNIWAQELNYYLSQFNSMQGPLSYYRTTELRFEEEKGTVWLTSITFLC
jgi:soluble epoxide hydrolase/lipid-phosphate phosphatase